MQQAVDVLEQLPPLRAALTFPRSADTIPADP